MSDNLLVNGGFDGEFEAWLGQSSVVVGEGWTPFYRPHGQEDDDSTNRKPEWKPAAGHPSRVHSGENAQQWFNFYGTNRHAGVYQRVQVVPGRALELRAWAQCWSSSDDEPTSGGPQGDGDLQVRVGVDLAGRELPDSADVIWAPWFKPYDEWMELSLLALVPPGEWVTVYLSSRSNYPVKHNDCYFDDVRLYQEGDPEEPPPPEPGTGLVARLRAQADVLRIQADRADAIADALMAADRAADDLAAML